VTPRKRLFVLAPICLTALVALWPAEVSAQRRVYRRAPVRTRVFVGVGFGYPGYGYPYYYSPFWPGYGYGYGMGYGFGYQYGPYPPYGYGYGYGYYGAELRIQVTPRQAEVYVDGYLTGTVDDFDGIFQRLRVPLGEHEITVYKEGYRTLHQRMLFRPFESYSLRETMQPLAAGDAPEPRPVPSERAPSQAPPPRGRAPMPAPGERNPDRNADRFGAVAVRVQPADADVFIDGERWETPAGENRLLVELSEGTHRVEIRKAGYKPYTSNVTIRSGETVTLNVSLPSGG
jgi:PEGA domain-containing protein